MWHFSSSTAFSVKGVQNLKANIVQILSKWDCLKMGVRISCLRQLLKQWEILTRIIFVAPSLIRVLCNSCGLSLMVEGRRTIATCALQGRYDRLITKVLRKKKNSWQPLIATKRETKLGTLRRRRYGPRARGPGYWQVPSGRTWFGLGQFWDGGNKSSQVSKQSLQNFWMTKLDHWKIFSSACPADADMTVWEISYLFIGTWPCSFESVWLLIALGTLVLIGCSWRQMNQCGGLASAVSQTPTQLLTQSSQ